MDNFIDNLYNTLSKILRNYFMAFWISLAVNILSLFLYETIGGAAISISICFSLQLVRKEPDAVKKSDKIMYIILFIIVIITLLIMITGHS